MVRDFASGDMKKEDVEKLLSTLGISSDVTFDGAIGTGNYKMTFEYNGKKYEIRYNFDLQYRDNDDKRRDVYSQSEILKYITQMSDINTYFTEVSNSAGKKSYTLKDNLVDGNGNKITNLEMLKDYLEGIEVSIYSPSGHYDPELGNSSNTYDHRQTDDGNHLYIKQYLKADGTGFIIEHQYTEAILDPIFEKEFGHNIRFGENGLPVLTFEEKFYCNQHPEVFPWCWNLYGEDKTLLAITNMDLEYNWWIEQGNYYSQDEVYNSWIKDFADSLNKDLSSYQQYSHNSFYKTTLYISPYDRRYSAPTPASVVKLEGDTVNFDEDSIKAIQLYLSEQLDEAPSYYSKLFGFNTTDTAEEIKDKIKLFCNKYGGDSENLTIPLEAYYLAIGGNNKPGVTYDECGKNFEDFKKRIKETSTEFSKIYNYNNGAYGGFDSGIDDGYGTARVSGTNDKPVQQVGGADGVSVVNDTSDINAARANVSAETSRKVAELVRVLENSPFYSIPSVQNDKKIQSYLKDLGVSYPLNKDDIVKLLDSLGISYNIEEDPNNSCGGRDDYSLTFTYNYKEYSWSSNGNYVAQKYVSNLPEIASASGVYLEATATEEQIALDKEEVLERFENRLVQYTDKGFPADDLAIFTLGGEVYDPLTNEYVMNGNSHTLPPVWQNDGVDTENNTVELGDHFIDIVRQYLQYALDNTHHSIGSTSGVYTNGFEDEWMNMLGFKTFYFPYENFKAYIQDFIDNPTKLKEHIESFCTSLGADDGKTVPIENYYNALADYHVFRWYSVSSTNAPLYKPLDRIENSSNAKCAMETLEINYPDVASSFGSDIYEVLTAGTIAGYVFFDSDVRVGIASANGNGLDKMAYNPSYQEVLQLAAGVKDGDSKSEIEAKLANLYKKIGCTSDGNYRMDAMALTNYLLGNNPEGVNYFETLLYKRERDARGITTSSNESLSIQAKSSSVNTGNGSNGEASMTNPSVSIQGRVSILKNKWSGSSVLSKVFSKIESLVDKVQTRVLSKMQTGLNQKVDVDDKEFVQNGLANKIQELTQVIKNGAGISRYTEDIKTKLNEIVTSIDKKMSSINLGENDKEAITNSLVDFCDALIAQLNKSDISEETKKQLFDLVSVLKGKISDVDFVNNLSAKLNDLLEQIQALALTSQTSKTADVPNNTTNTQEKPQENVIINVLEALKLADKNAKVLNLIGTLQKGVYNSSSNFAEKYYWNAQNKKFEKLDNNLNRIDNKYRNYVKAMLEAYKQGYNFTTNFPYVCEKDGIYYEYDEKSGKFIKKE